MTDPNSSGKSGKWLWIVILVLLLIVILVWFRDPVGEVEAPGAEATPPPSSEWIEENPDEAKVPVTLPNSSLESGTEAPTDGAGSSSGAGE